MPRNSPPFQSFSDFISFSAAGNVVSLSFGQGYQHIRRFSNDCLQFQIGTEKEPDFFSYSIENQEFFPMLCEQDEDIVEVFAAGGSFSMDTGSGHWMWSANQRLLWQTEPGLGFGKLGQEIVAAFHLEKDAAFFGLGEKTGSLNRRNSAFTNWNTDAFAYGEGRDPLYVSIPFYLTVKEGVCYGILLDNTCKSRFSFGAGNKRMLQISVAHGPMNLIFIPGPRPEDVLRRYHELTGKMAMPPRWALGLQQCRYSYYPEHELLAVAQNFRDRNIPCDVLYLDIHYMDGYKVFTVDKSRFPDMAATTKKLLDAGFRVVPIQDPGIKAESGYLPFDDGKKEEVFVKYPDGEDWIAGVWPGDCVFPDFTAEKGRAWWSALSARWVEETGVSGLWNDMNEPAVWGQDVPDMLEFSLENRGGSHAEAHNVYGQLMASASRRGLMLAKPGERPFVLTRAGFAGIHRYAAVWSGDNVANEEHMFLGIRLVLSMAMSGVSFSGPDVGGFVGDAGKNLFMRWVSIASFFPFFRLHSMIDSRDNEPWSYGELAEAIAGNYIRLRYKLLPMLYSAMAASSQSGLPVLQPYFWSKPALEFEPEFQHQFFFCRNLLIIPAASDQQAVWAGLPEGNFYHLLTGQCFTGNQSLWIASPADTLPVLVKAGSILMTQSVGTCTEDSGAGGIGIHLFYGSEKAVLSCHLDDGISLHAKEDERAEWEISFDFELQQLDFKLISGKMGLQVAAVFLWHFPDSCNEISLRGKSLKTENSRYDWLESLPNFDPFEDKGKSYFGECKKIVPGEFFYD